MKNNGIRSKIKRKFKVTTNSKHTHATCPNLLAEALKPTAINEQWVADITYIRTDEGWLYLSTIMDLFSRRILGWTLREYLGKELVIEALRKAITGYQITADTIFHSDRGVQFTAEQFRQLLIDLGITQSMSGRGNCYDNAPIESFFHTLKNELLLSGQLETRYKTRIAIFEYIEIYYNKKRLHSSLKYKTPDEVYNSNIIS